MRKVYEDAVRFQARKIMNHWLYQFIPPARSAATGWRIIMWALFGNDEDGACGEHSDVPTFDGVAPSFTQFVRWQLRNPLHNLCFHVLVWRTNRALVLIEYPPLYVWHTRPPRIAVAPTGNQFQLVLAPPFVYWRLGNWESYAGFRERGNLGFAFRSCHKQ